MTSFVLQLLNLLQTGHVQLFLLFFLFIQIFWWTRVYIASKNKRYTEPYKGNVAVIVAVLREDPEVFEESLKSIKEFGKPRELIVSIDDYTHADKHIKQIAKKYATTIIEQPTLLGKREQYAVCTKKVKEDTDVIITVDSDTIWDETTVNILKPFRNPKVGAVSGRQTIFRSHDTFIRRIAQWFEDLRFSVTLPFQSYFGQVNVVPGRTLAARADVYRDVAEIVRNETFFGRRIITSDDASVTMEILKAGYQVVYQDDSHVTTDAPDTIKGFFNQYLRWYRGAYRRFFSRFSQLIRMNFLVFLASVEFLFFTFIYAGIVLAFIFKLVFHVYAFGAFTGYPIVESFSFGFFLLLVLGYFVSSYLRNLPHLLRDKRDFLFLPIFAVFTFIIMAPLKLIAAFTMFENGWLTRLSQSRHDEKNLIVSRVGAVFLSCLMLVVTVPLAYAVDISPTHVPFSVIVAGDGPAYYKAQQVILAYQDKQATNDKQQMQTIKAVYETRNGKEQKITAAAIKCVDSALSKDAASASTTKPFQVFDSCHLTASEQVRTASTSVTTKKQTATAPAPYILTTGTGDSQTTLIRSLLAAHGDKTLNPSQEAFVENHLVSLIGNQNLIYSGQQFTVTHEQLQTATNQSKTLTSSELAAWSQYAS